MNYLDLTQRPPRSARVRLGGYVILPRCLDKGRAQLQGKNGAYHFNCPLDQRFINFMQISADALKEQLALGKSDGEILTWIHANSKNKPSPWEIKAWSHYQENQAPSDVEFRDFIQGMHSEIAPHRKDIESLFDLLDLDDYVSYGGQP